MLTSGCGLFSPEEEPPTGPPPPPVYPILDHPRKVLRAFEIAYEAIDTTKFQDLYDSTYTGTSTDLNDPSPPIPFTVEEEKAHIRDLALTPGIRTYLTIGTESTWARLGSDDPSHPEWAVIQITGSDWNVQIADGNNIFEAQGGPGTFIEFAFTPTEDETSPTDTLWKIVRWKEVGASQPNP